MYDFGLGGQPLLMTDTLKAKGLMGGALSNHLTCISRRPLESLHTRSQCNEAIQDPVASKRKDQGQHECEVLSLTSGEESAAAWEDCEKTPGHPGFIPIGQFGLRNLPFWCRESRLVDLIHGLAQITVRVRVNYTSLSRPDGYAFSQNKGSKILHVGSGYVSSIQDAFGPCLCRECKASPEPLQHGYHIYISTACHVVFDTAESRATNVDLFYDTEDSKMRTMWGVDVVAKLAQEDWCVMRCVTHDAELANQLRGHVDAVERSTPEFSYLNGDKPSVCVVVSHPHGMSKQVTFGQVKDWTPLRFLSTEFHYSTSTCAGSSGGPVFVAFPREGGCRKWLGPHSGFVYLQPWIRNKSGSCVEISESKFSGLVGRNHPAELSGFT